MKRIVITMVAAATAAMLSMPVSAHAAASDTWITTKAKMALLTTDGVSGMSVNVDTVDGRVTLHGKVRTEAEKKAAGDAVAKIEGAREVRNLLQIVPEKSEQKVEASDEQITTNVKDAFAKDKQLADSGIAVQSVNKGVVLLAGETDSATTHLRAVTTASAVPGVRRVATEVKGGERHADADRGRHADADHGRSADADHGRHADADHGRSGDGVMKEAKDRVATGGAKASDAVSDAYVTSKVKLSLLANSETPAMDINVDTTNGQVTLFGVVPTAAAKAAAEAEARKVGGVKGVRNDLQVVAEQRQEAVAAKDADIENAVQSALEKREAATGNDVQVEVKDGVVRLTGTVPSEDARVTAATAARSTRGVKAVLSEDLRIESAKAADNRS